MDPLYETPTRKYCFPRILYTSNPGGIGHDYLKKAIVIPSKRLPESTIFIAPDEDGGFLRQFVPAKLRDNPAILAGTHFTLSARRLPGRFFQKHAIAMPFSTFVYFHFPVYAYRAFSPNIADIC
jgi:hypothetical protein